MASNTGACTRWSSSGCGNLDGFTSASSLPTYEVNQWTQGSAFKYRGFSWQQEYHDKEVKDTATGLTHDLDGGYAQAGYFFHNLMPAVPKELELAARYSRVNEPNQRISPTRTSVRSLRWAQTGSYMGQDITIKSLRIFPV